MGVGGVGERNGGSTGRTNSGKSPESCEGGKREVRGLFL